MLAEPHFADGCVVIIDDTNWEPVREGTQVAVDASRGTYETLADVRTASGDHMTFWNGLMVLRYRRPAGG